MYQLLFLETQRQTMVQTDVWIFWAWNDEASKIWHQMPVKWMFRRTNVSESFKKPVKNKVHIFREGHKILRNLHRRFDRYYIGQIYSGDFAKICSLLRIYELYHPLKAVTFLSLHFLATVGLEGQKCQLFSLQISGCFMLMSGWHTIKFGLIHWADTLPNFWLRHHGPNCRRYQPQKQSTLFGCC